MKRIILFWFAFVLLMSAQNNDVEINNIRSLQESVDRLKCGDVFKTDILQQLEVSGFFFEREYGRIN